MFISLYESITAAAKPVIDDPKLFVAENTAGMTMAAKTAYGT